MSVCYEISGAVKMSTPASSVPCCTIQDKKDRDNLEKLLKAFALKSAQIIVQSRSGEKVETKCNPNATEEWFHLAINDIPEVSAKARNAMSNAGAVLPLCVEISLTTNDQETMTLETWCVRLHKDGVDTSVGATTYPLYTRLSLLLKSLISITRCTLAYKLSRKKSDYTIHHRIYVGEPQLTSLGLEVKELVVGHVATSFGNVQLSATCRTKLTISPQHSKSPAMMVKSDHFSSDDKSQDSKSPPSNKPVVVKLGAFADPMKIVPPELPPIPFSHLLPKKKDPSPEPDNTTSDKAQVTGNANNEACANSPNTNEACALNALADEVNANNSVYSSCTSVCNDNDRSQFEKRFDQMFPFASVNTSSVQLFHQECSSAPPLKSFAELTVEEQVGDVEEQIEEFQKALPVFEEVLTFISQSENGNK